MAGPYFEGQKQLDCGHYFPDVLAVMDKKVGENYIRVLDCKFCGRSEMPLNPYEISSDWVKKLDRESVVIMVEEGKIEEVRQNHLERLTLKK